ncbi:hypothetical protein [Lysinibacter cavernae]|uniref:YbaB/EbfC family DNA-binding protein n=1 Tax=Lysinibacter cavernae TaxID=1640652 RepID=A0A7X5R217_9MICO|nr:hypothetical protein [Lysinibacter cavernae]NIH53987.1 hypothetical protein [Lysinibacter cavernae]
MTSNIFSSVDRLKAFQRNVARAKIQLQLVADDASEGISGTDEKAIVRFQVDADSRPIRIQLDPAWERCVRWSDLGPTIMEAYNRALHSRAEIWGQALVDVEQAPISRVDLHTHDETQIDSKRRANSLGQRFEELLDVQSELGRYTSRASDLYAASRVFNSSDGCVALQAEGVNISSLEFEENRIKFMSAESIERSVLEVFQNAWSVSQTIQEDLESEFPKIANYKRGQ